MRNARPDLVPMSERFRSARIPLFQVIDDLSLYKPASFVQRWYALTLDIAFLGPLNVLVGIPFARQLEHLEVLGQTPKLILLGLFIKLTPILIYVVFPTWLTGQTLGKRMVGIKIIQSDYRPSLSLGQVFLRETLGKLLVLLTLGFGIIAVFSSRRRRGWHDRLSRTMVIDVS